MGDTVQRLLEDMVPELEDLQSRSLFTKGEIQSLVSHRTDFEYKLRRKNIAKLDFLRYIQYELNLVALLEKRKSRRAVKGKNGRMEQEKKGVAEFASMRRLAFLYERALRKFNHDIHLWKQYLEYCRSTGSFHAISKILPRALQLNPKEISLWILHAEWEENVQGNMDGARTILQRALRLNENSRELFHKFFEMELKFLAKINERKRLLGLVKTAKGKALTEAEQESGMGDFDLRFKGGEEGGAAGEDAVDEGLTPLNPQSAALVAKQAEALSLALIPRMIYRNAIKNKQLAGDLEFRLAFLRSIPSAFSAALSALSLGGIDDDAEEEGEGADKKKHSLSSFAYNHNEHDALLTNFLKFNDESISAHNHAALQQQEEKRKKDNKKNGGANAAAAAMEDGAEEQEAAPQLKVASSGPYHVNFLPLIAEILASIKRDFYHSPAQWVPLQAEFEYTRQRIQRDFEESEAAAAAEEASEGANKEPEEVACAAFEKVLHPSYLPRVQASASAFLQANRASIEISASNAATNRAVQAQIDELRNPEKALWGSYVDFLVRLLKLSPANESLRQRLAQIYERSEGRGISGEKITERRAEFLLESGEVAQAIGVLEGALIPSASSSSSSSSSSSASSSAAALKSSLALWLRYLEVLETLSAFHSAADASSAGDDEAQEKNKKRKKHAAASSSSSSSSSSAAHSIPSISPELVLTRFDQALSSVGAADRPVLYERFLSFQIGRFTAVSHVTSPSSSSPSSHSTLSPPLLRTLQRLYVSIHASFRSILSLVPQPAPAVIDRVKRQYLEWMSRTAGGESYALLQRRSGAQKKAASTPNKQAQQMKNKKTNSSLGKRAAADSDSDDDEDSSSDADPLPPFIPSFALSSFDAVRSVSDFLLSSPPFTLSLLQLALHVEGTFCPSTVAAAASSSASSSSSSTPSAAALSQTHLRRMKDLYEKGVSSFGAVSPPLWFSYLCWARSQNNSGLANPNQIHFRATKEIKDEEQAHWAELQTRLVQ